MAKDRQRSAYTVATVVLVAGLLIALVTVSNNRTGEDENLVATASQSDLSLDSSHDRGYAKVLSGKEHQATEVSHNEQVHQAMSDEYESTMLGELAIDEFILTHLKLAEAGSAESAYFLSEAMKYCSADIITFDLTIEQYRDQFRGNDLTPQEQSDQIMDSLIGFSDFYRGEVRRHLGRAIECRRLGWDPGYLLDEGANWGKAALQGGQVVAVALDAMIKPGTKNVDPDVLKKSKRTMRDLLQDTRDLQVFVYASTVVAASTGRDAKDERLAWRLLACEYKSCEKLNYNYRHNCEVMSLNGSDLCTDGMTDRDYIFRKYPERYDLAQARALEIKQALDAEDWLSLGLE